MLVPLIVAGTGAVALAGAGGLLTKIGPWYRELRKPGWNPPDWVFGPVWTTILGLAAWSAALAWESASPAQRPVVVALFLVNATFHLLWTPLFFMLQRPDWALAEVPLLWLSVLVLVIVLSPISNLASLLLLPYLVWVAVAMLLNYRIVQLNRPFGPAQPGSH